MKIKIISLLLLIFIFCASTSLQQEDKPKLIVGIVIDQMRAEYIYRFQENYSENGIKRLLKEGFNVKNVHYNYIPTSTGPGHASIYTGTTPSRHGIVANNWYDKTTHKKVNCVEDKNTFYVDNRNKTTVLPQLNKYANSPKKLMTSTITDELKLISNRKSKVIGISLKNRGAIFPAGHMADYAFWYNNTNGDFITSSYYTEKLPAWLHSFNNQKKVDSLLNLVWETQLPIDQYTNSDKDDVPFEKKISGKTTSTFPYDLKKLRKENNNFELLEKVPFGNTIITQLAIKTIESESLGKGSETDFLAISYSSTDYIGHNFGIRSKELEDTYVRMDKELSKLLETLDKQVGKGKYLLFLTADHGASDNPYFLKNKKLPGEFYDLNEIKKKLNTHLGQKFGAGEYISSIDDTYIYFSDKTIQKEQIIKESISFLKTVDGIKEVVAPALMETNLNNSTIDSFIKNSFYAQNSGDILMHFHAGWMAKRSYGTTHGTSYTGDTHVPLLWYGWKIPAGETSTPYTITQIAPTLSFLLDIPLPNASNTHPILELCDP